MELRKATSSIVFALLTIVMAGSMMSGCSSDEFEGPKKTLAGRTRCSSGEDWRILRLTSRKQDSNDGHKFWGDENLMFEVQIDWTGGYVDRSPHAEIYFMDGVKVFSERYRFRNSTPTDSVISLTYKVKDSDTWIKWTSGYSMHHADVQIRYELFGTVKHSNGDGTCTIKTDTIDETIHEVYDIPLNYFE